MIPQRKAAKKAAPRREYTVATTRFYPVARELVFECWTRAEHIAHWFAPKGFSLHSCEADARPGGIFKLCMRAPWGDEYWVRGSYREVVAPERLVIECRAHDESGVERLEEVIQVTLATRDGGTLLTLNALAGGSGREAERMLGGMEQGWSETLDRLGDRAQR
jgi:uncharacterized protein YndB with AHSA1/START domain